MSEAAALIELRHLRILNANAVSGPLSWGFPPPTAFTGFVHALQRRLGEVTLGGVGIVSHRFDPQVYRPAGSYTQVFRLARHPYIAGWKKFENKAAAIVEEGRAHLVVSLLIEVITELDEEERDELAARIRALLPGMRLAGGSIVDSDIRVRVTSWPEYEEDQTNRFRRLRYRLLPGFTLVQRDDLLTGHLQTLHQQARETDALDAFLDMLALHVDPVQQETTETVHWQVRSSPGWLVPVATGYAALGPLHAPGEVANTRDSGVPFRFVESLYTIGQWLGPHRLSSLGQMLWHTETDKDNGIYCCRNDYPQLDKEHSYGED